MNHIWRTKYNGIVFCYTIFCCYWNNYFLGIFIGRKSKNVIVRDCRKCVYEVGCHGNPVGCKCYRRDVPDGGYYG